MINQQFAHVYHDRNADQTLFLLHGTGGDEHDLIPLAKDLPYNLVGVRGNVRENGMNRFFARFPSGEFDEESILTEAKKLSDFVEVWKISHPQQTQKVAFLGYSNGANMIAAMARLYPTLGTSAALLHPAFPLPQIKNELTTWKFLITIGENDHMIDPTQAEELVALLAGSGAKVEVVRHIGGHEIRTEELQAVREFLI